MEGEIRFSVAVAAGVRVCMYVEDLISVGGSCDLCCVD